MCYAEDLVAQIFAANQDALAGISSSQHRNYNRYLEGLKESIRKRQIKITQKRHMIRVM